MGSVHQSVASGEAAQKDMGCKFQAGMGDGMLDDKTSGIAALFLLAVAELTYCYFAQAVPVHTGTIVGAIAGFVTGLKYEARQI